MRKQGIYEVGIVGSIIMSVNWSVAIVAFSFNELSLLLFRWMKITTQRLVVASQEAALHGTQLTTAKVNLHPTTTTFNRNQSATTTTATTTISSE